MIPNLTKIHEGTTKLIVPVEEKLLKKNPVFYNPEMEFSRDISIAATKILKPDYFCDLLSASGARGVRIANETNTQVLANDINPTAYELIKKNISLNNLDNSLITAVNLSAHNLLIERNFDFIDIDPFGSPVQFMDSALRAIANRGTIAIAATDTAALCGTYPRACRRKYDSQALRTEYYNELGLRILIGFAARCALKYDIGIEPIFSHCTRHYFRTYLKVTRGRKYVNENIRNLNYIRHCYSCFNREYKNLNDMEKKCSCGETFKNAGPLWIGKFADTDFCENLEVVIENSVLNSKNRALKMTSLIKNEQEIYIPYYDIHKICKKLRIPAPGTDELMRKLKEEGFRVSRTHFCGTGIRTDASVEFITSILLPVKFQETTKSH